MCRFAKFFILFFLNVAHGDQGPWMAEEGLPKNIILILSDSLTYETVTLARSEQAKTSLNISSSSLHVLPFERMPSHGVLVKMAPRSSRSKQDLLGLQTMFNGPLSEENCEGASKRNYSSNLLLLAQKAGKASGLITTTNVMGRIPASIYTNSLFASADCLNLAVSNHSNVLHHLVHGDIGGNLDVILGKSFDSFKLNQANQEINDEYSDMDPEKLLELINSTNRVLVRSPEELHELSSENGKKVFGIFPKIDDKHLNAITLKALEILSKNEKGFFLTVIIERKNPINAVRMVSAILERFQKVDSLVKSLLVVTSASTKMAKGNIPCSIKHSSPINISQNIENESFASRDKYSFTEIEQSMTATAFEQKNRKGMPKNDDSVNEEHFHKKTTNSLAGKAIPVKKGTFGAKLDQSVTTLSPDEKTNPELEGKMYEVLTTTTFPDDESTSRKKGAFDTGMDGNLTTNYPDEKTIPELMGESEVVRTITPDEERIPGINGTLETKIDEMEATISPDENTTSPKKEIATSKIIQAIKSSEMPPSTTVVNGDDSKSSSYNTESILQSTDQGGYSTKEDSRHDAKKSYVSNTNTKMVLENTSDEYPITTEKFTDDLMSSSSTTASVIIGTPQSEVPTETSIFDQTLITTVPVAQSYTTENIIEKLNVVDLKDTIESSIGKHVKREAIYEKHLLDMPIYASGPASNLFRGVHKVDFLWKVIKESICLDQFDLPECDRHYAKQDHKSQANVALDAEISSNSVLLWHWSLLENVLVALILIIILS